MIYTIDDNKIEIKIKRHWILKMIKERKILNKRLSKTLSEKRAKNIINGDEILFGYVLEQFEFDKESTLKMAKELEKEYQNMVHELLIRINLQLRMIKNE